jgi:alpha-glucosidase
MFMLGFGLSAAEAQRPQRATTRLGDFHLSMAIAGDDVWLFELSEGEIDPGRPFEVSPMVVPGLSLSLPAGGGGLWSSETASVRIARDPAAAIVITRRNAVGPAFSIMPYAPDGRLSGISFTGEYSHLLGLGADFNQATETINLLGETVMPGGPFGNRRLSSFGYRPNQVQIPVLYALGADSHSSALFIDETRPLMWNFKGRPWTASTAGPLGPDGTFRFFVVLGPDMPSLRRAYMNIVGRPLAPPLEALGVWARETDEVKDADWAHKLAQLKSGVPGLAGLSLKSGDEKKTALREAAKVHNLKIMVDESAYVPVNSGFFSELSRRSYLVRQNGPDGSALLVQHYGQDSGLVDYTNSAVPTFWHSLFREDQINSGISSFRLTDGDLYDFSASAYYEGPPGGNIHSHYAWANRYSLLWLEGVYAGAANQRMRSKPRLLLLSRTAAAGLARYGGALYNGESFLYNFRSLMAAKAHVSLAGIDYYSSDISQAFKNRPPDQNTAQAYEAWTARSALTDLPLVLPEEMLLTPGARYNLAVRESLRPYYYSLAWMAYRHGDPVIAPLAYYFQDDLAARDRIGELMLGPHLLLGLSLDGGTEQTSVYVPRGRWYDWRTGEALNQEAPGLVSLDLKVAGQISPPILARAGAVIPALETVNRLDGSAEKIAALKIFIGEEPSEFIWYEDDGQTRDYLRDKDGKYGRTVVSAVTGPDGSTVVAIKAREGSWEGAPTERRLLVDIYGPKAPGEATLDGLPHNRLARISELDEIEAGWASSGNNQLRFKTPPLDMSRDHVFWFK